MNNNSNNNNNNNNNKKKFNKIARQTEKMFYKGVADAVPGLTEDMINSIGSVVKKKTKKLFRKRNNNNSNKNNNNDVSSNIMADSNCVNISARVLANIKALTLLALKGQMSNIGIPLCLYTGLATRPAEVNKVFRFTSFAKDTFASQSDNTFALILRPATSMSNSVTSYWTSATDTTFNPSGFQVSDLTPLKMDTPYESSFFNTSATNDATSAFPYAVVMRIKLNSIQSNQGGQCVGVITSESTTLEGSDLSTLLTNYVQSRALILDNDWVYMIRYGSTTGPETNPGNAGYGIMGFIGTTTTASQPMSYEIYVLQAVTGSGVMSQSEPYVPDISSDVMLQSIFAQNQELAFGNVSTSDLDSVQETFCKYFARTSSVGRMY